MKAIILLIVGLAFLLAGWGWHMSPRWVRLLCRTFTVYCVLAILVILGWNWIKPYYILLIIPFIAVLFGFFWELIPFPILQFFKADNITTIRVERKVDQSIDLLRDIKQSPENFIFPYIQLVNISPIINNQYYLDVIGSLPSVLPYHLTLKDVYAQLFIVAKELQSKQPIIVETKKQRIIEGDNTNKSKVRKSIILRAENRNDLSNFRICLSKKAREQAIEIFHQNRAVEVTLEISGYDNKGRWHKLSTNRMSMALLNGGELK